MRYLLLTPNANGHDGVSRLTRLVAVALSSLGGDVDVWSLSDDAGGASELSEQSISVRGAGGVKARTMLWSLAGLGRDRRGLTVVVLHAHLAPLSLPFLCRGARVFQFLLGIEVWKSLTALQAFAYRTSERLICISDHTQRRFLSANPGFDSTMVCHLGIPDHSLASRIEDEGFALIVGRIASCERYKGHDAILDVWHDVRREAPNAQLVVVGDGDDRERLMIKAKERGHLATIRFTGSVSDDDLDRLYRRCAFFIMPSVNEGFGLVFLEAMRASKACIGGIGAASEIIVDGETGFVVDPSDSASVTRSVVELFRQPERRAQMGSRGYERFLRHFTSAHFRERLRAAVDIDTRG
jgi:glycosyltransferase involved in cell wall biosynthesis